MWYDHQWGTGFMPNGAPSHGVVRASQNLTPAPPGGWDWFMFQFYQNDKISKDGEVQITVSALHTIGNERFYFQSGSRPADVMKADFVGKYIDEKNNVTNLTGEMQIYEWVQVNFSPNPEIFPPTNTWYPAKYGFMIDGNIDIPDALKMFTVTPLIQSGPIDGGLINTGQTGFFGNGLQYTEGGVIVTDSYGVEIGRGFAEGTNWADCTKGIVNLAGLPVNDQTLGFLKAPNVSLIMKICSLLKVTFGKAELEQILSEAKGL